MNTETQTYHPDTPLKSLIPTKRMYRWLEQMLERREAYVANVALYAVMTKTIAVLMRSIRDTEVFNYRIKTKWEMLRDPDWRARVLRELGGEKTLQRWEARKAKADTSEWQPRAPRKPISRKIIDTPKTPNRPRFKTDSQGQFRLAVVSIKRPWYIKPEPRDRSGERRRSGAIILPDLSNIKYPIIPLEAHELRRASPSVSLPDISKVTVQQSAPFISMPSRAKRLALGTASDFVLDTSTPQPHAVLNLKWTGIKLSPD